MTATIEPEVATSEPQVETSAVSQFAGHELKTLAKHSSHYLAGILGGLTVGLVSFPVFTRVLTVSEYGLLDLAQKLAGMLTTGAKAGLQNATLRFYNKDEFAADPAAAKRYYSTMLLGAMATAALVVAAFLAVIGLGPRNLAGPLSGLVYFIAAMVLLRGVGSIQSAFLRIEERTKIYNFVSVGVRVTTVAVVCTLMLWAGRSAKTYLTGSIIVEAAVAALLVLWLLKRNVLDARCVDPSLFRSGLGYGLPLVVYEFSFSLLASADRFLVLHYLGATSLGFYTVAYSLAQNANDLLVNPLGLAILPIYMRIWSTRGARKTTEFLTLTLDLFMACSVGVLAIATGSAHQIVVLLASSKYAGVDKLIPILLAGLMIYAMYIFAAAGLLIHKRTMQMAGLLVVAAAVNIGLNVLLLPHYGLNGSVTATLVSYTLSTVLLWCASSRYLAPRFQVAALAKYLAAAAVAWLAASWIEWSSPLATLLAKAALTAMVYLAGLYVLDSRVRRVARWGVAWCKAAL